MKIKIKQQADGTWSWDILTADGEWCSADGFATRQLAQIDADRSIDFISSVTQ